MGEPRPHWELINTVGDDEGFPDVVTVENGHERRAYAPAADAGAAERPTCATCPFFEATDDGVHGLCRRLPPRFQFRSELNPGGTFADDWPTVGTEDWCGEHPRFPAYLASLSPTAPGPGASGTAPRP